MKYIYQITLFIALTTAGCSQEAETLEEKKAQLKVYNEDLKELNKKIADLKADLAQSDSNFTQNKTRNEVLVAAQSVAKQNFNHKVEVRGAIESDQNVMLSAEMAGKIMGINVSEGDYVTKGKVLVTLDADILRNNIAELRTSLELANAVYQRQANLWKKNIGTEIQYLEAKNNKESLERKLATANSQLAKATIRAPFAGSVDEIPARVGEIASPGVPLIRIVSPNNMYIKADVSESMLGKFKSGQQVEVHFPALDETVTSSILSVGQVIKSENRTFEIQVDMPNVDFTVKPNQVVVIKLSDYVNGESIVVPTKIIQRDNNGSYVYEVSDSQGGQIAQKVYVTTGQSYQFQTEILDGLNVGQVIVYEGFRELAPGLNVRVVE